MNKCNRIRCFGNKNGRCVVTYGYRGSKDVSVLPRGLGLKEDK